MQPILVGFQSCNTRYIREVVSGFGNERIIPEFESLFDMHIIDVRSM